MLPTAAPVAGETTNPDRKHQEYSSVLPDWLLCRDLFTGERAMKNGDRRREYIVPLSGHKDTIPGGADSYKAYVERAYFFGAYGRTVEALTGLINRVDPTIEAPSALTEFLADVDGQGTGSIEFCAQIVEELVKVGRVGVLTDWPMRDDKTRVVAEDAADYRRPFLTTYHAENIINWRVSRIGAKAMLSMVVVQESEITEGANEFESVVVQQIRVFDLPGGIYRIRKFQLSKSRAGDKAGRWEQVGTDLYPTIGIGGTPTRMREIQFEILNHWGCGPQAKKPPMLDLGNTCVAHFRNSADYENAIHLFGFPQLYMNNFDAGNENDLDPTSAPGTKSVPKVYHIGDGSLWQFKGPVEVQAIQLNSELSGLEKAMESKRADMVALGARMLAKDKMAAESARVEEIRRQPENSALGKIAQAGSKGLAKIFQRVADWLKISGKINVELNTNFFDHEMAPADLISFIQAVQEGAFALSDLRWLMRRGNLIRAGRTDEEIDAELEQAGMPLSAAGRGAVSVDDSLPDAQPQAEDGGTAAADALA